MNIYFDVLIDVNMIQNHEWIENRSDESVQSCLKEKILPEYADTFIGPLTRSR